MARAKRTNKTLKEAARAAVPKQEGEAVVEFARAMADIGPMMSYAVEFIGRLRNKQAVADRDECATLIERMVQVLESQEKQVSSMRTYIEAAHERYMASLDRVALAERAAQRFGGGENDGLFETANVQHLLKDLIGPEPFLSGERVARFLEAEPSIVRLAGGCYWLLLPKGYKRYQGDPAKS